MASRAGVSVALPVYRAEPGSLGRSVACIRDQTLRELDIAIVLNGSDPATTRLAHDLASQDGRIRVHSLPAPNLAAALNLALREARFDLVARMDADDECPPGRLARQTAFLEANPRIAAVGSGVEIRDESGNTSVAHPPTDPAEVRWRLCLGNVLCHGAMMLRRAEVMAVGGYDPRYQYAQDYDLWLRL